MKLPQTELHNYINKAWLDWDKVNKDPRARYRFGQSLFNVLPKEVTDKIHGTEKDFFYWDDERLEEILCIVCTEFVE